MVGGVVQLGNGIVKALPAQFLALVVINSVFVLALLYFMHEVMKDRITAFRDYSVACTTALHEAALRR